MLPYQERNRFMSIMTLRKISFGRTGKEENMCVCPPSFSQPARIHLSTFSLSLHGLRDLLKTKLRKGMYFGSYLLLFSSSTVIFVYSSFQSHIALIWGQFLFNCVQFDLCFYADVQCLMMHLFCRHYCIPTECQAVCLALEIR